MFVEVTSATGAAGRAALSLDVDDATGQVVGVQLVNDTGQPCTISLERPSGALVTVVAGSGTFYRSLPRPRQFSYWDEAADWWMTLAVRLAV